MTRILLADDDPAIRRALGMSLTRAGFLVTVVDDGEIAIELSREQTFDVVIADYNMLRVGGVVVIRHFKELFGSNVCCVILSGEDDGFIHTACVLAGADDVLVKPVRPAELRARVVQAAHVLQARRAA